MSPIASRVASSCAASSHGSGTRHTDISRNADFDASAWEKATFEADEKIYNAFTAGAAA
jgi:hypothetical protein